MWGNKRQTSVDAEVEPSPGSPVASAPSGLPYCAYAVRAVLLSTLPVHIHTRTFISKRIDEYKHTVPSVKCRKAEGAGLLVISRGFQLQSRQCGLGLTGCDASSVHFLA